MSSRNTRRVIYLFVSFPSRKLPDSSLWYSNKFCTKFELNTKYRFEFTVFTYSMEVQTNLFEILKIFIYVIRVPLYCAFELSSRRLSVVLNKPCPKILTKMTAQSTPFTFVRNFRFHETLAIKRNFLIRKPIERAYTRIYIYIVMPAD